MLIAIGAVACVGLAYKDAMTDLEPGPEMQGLPPGATRQLPDGRLLMKDGSIRKA